MDKFIRKKRGTGPKNVKELIFLGFHILLHENTSQFYCAAPMMLQLTGYSQDFTHFFLEGGETKIRPQNSSQFLFATSEFSRVSRS